MDQNNNSRQWDDLLEQAFGSAGKPDASFSPSASPIRKRPFYRRRRFLIAVVAAVLLGVVIWLLADKTQRERPTLPGYDTVPAPEDSTMQDALALCKNSLARWQAKKTYHINISYLHYGDTMGGASEADFWHNGDDFLYTMVIPALGTTMGYLKQNGTLYTSSASNYGGASSYDWEPNTSEELQDSDLIPWPMAFDWDTSEITGLSTVIGSENRFSSVSFAVLQGSDNFNSPGPYHVHFTFHNDQSLDSVTVILTYPGSGSQTRTTVITFRMGTETESEIEMKVGTALRMPLIPPEPIDTDPA